MKTWKRMLAALLAVAMMLSCGMVSAFAAEVPDYGANRGVLTPSELMQLPLGAVRPQGWLENQLLLMKENITGLMKEHANYNYATSYWLNGTSGENWEKGMYFARGLAAMAYVLDDEELLEEAMQWIKAVLG